MVTGDGPLYPAIPRSSSRLAGDDTDSAVAGDRRNGVPGAVNPTALDGGAGGSHRLLFRLAGYRL
ncbi:hypothetical protein D3C87_1555920 [compost metagenome]